MTKANNPNQQPIDKKEIAEALRQIGLALNSTLDYGEVLDRILEQLGRVIHYDTASIMLIEDNTVRDVRWSGYDRFGAEAQIASAVFNILDTPNLKTMQETGQPLIIPETQQYDGWKSRPGGGWARSYLGTPIHSRGHIIGFLNVDSVTPGFYGQVEADHILAFADQVAIAIQNARLYTQARQEISERQQAEAALRRYQEQLEELVAERTADLRQLNEQLQAEIAERKQAEAALRQHTLELQARNEELDTFAHTVAHDLKNPIGVMTGFADVLAADHAALPPEALSEYLQAIAKSGRKANTIIEELLLLAGLRHQAVERTTLDMAGIVAEAQHRLQPMLDQYQASLTLPSSWPVALGYPPWI
jgi:GAF domain-containing protein